MACNGNKLKADKLCHYPNIDQSVSRYHIDCTLSDSYDN